MTRYFKCLWFMYLFVYLPDLLQQTDNVLCANKEQDSGPVKQAYSMLKYNPCEEIKSPQSIATPLEFYTSQGVLQLLCDTLTNGGRWIYIQRHTNNVTDFIRNWTDYSLGFGTIDTDFWIGNELIHQLTSWDNYELRIDMIYYAVTHFARYRHFKVGKESSNYRLSVNTFLEGSVTDQFSYHDGCSFSTPDRDNDYVENRSCAIENGSGWWYRRCQKVNLNNNFFRGYWGRGAAWEGLTSVYETLTSTEMKIRTLL